MRRLGAVAIAALVVMARPAAADVAEDEQAANAAWQGTFGADDATRLSLLLKATRLDPDKGLYFIDLADLYVRLRRHRDAIWAYDRAEKLGEPMYRDDGLKRAIAEICAGRFERARDVAEHYTAAFPDDMGGRLVRVATVYALEGRQAAENAAAALPPENVATYPSIDRWALFYLIHKNMIRWGDLAQTAGDRYAQLALLGVQFELCRDRLKWTNPDTAGRKELGDAAWELEWRIAHLYRSLPVKPAPTPRAMALALEAQGMIDARDFYGAEKKMQEAINASPWWPDAHHNFALTAENIPYTINVDHGSNFASTNSAVAGDEYRFVYLLDPRGPRAADARKGMKRHGTPIPEFK